MCRISDKLKLCTCHHLTGEEPNYWVLHRYNKTLKNDIVGEAMLPSWLDPEEDAYNKDLLLQMLNECNVFDKDHGLKQRDRLQITMHLPAKSELHYGFEYRRGKWYVEDYYVIEWMWKHERKEMGVIKSSTLT